MGARAAGTADWQPTSVALVSEPVIPVNTRGVMNTASSAARLAAIVTSDSLPPAMKSRMSADRICAAACSASRTANMGSAICGNSLRAAGGQLCARWAPGPASTRNSPRRRLARPQRAVTAGRPA